MWNGNLLKKTLKNIAPTLMFIYAILLGIQIYLTDEITKFSQYGMAFVYSFIWVFLSIGVYKKYSFAEAVAMLFSVSYVLATILNFFGFTDFLNINDSSIFSLILTAIVALIHLGILISLFKIRYKRSQELTKNFKPFPNRQNL